MSKKQTEQQQVNDLANFLDGAENQTQTTKASEFSDEMNFESVEADEPDQFDDFFQFSKDGDQLIGRYKGVLNKKTESKVLTGLIFETKDKIRYATPLYSTLTQYFIESPDSEQLIDNIFRITRLSKRQLKSGNSFINFKIERQVKTA
jgi:hypothetical protein